MSGKYICTSRCTFLFSYQNRCISLPITDHRALTPGKKKLPLRKKKTKNLSKQKHAFCSLLLHMVNLFMSANAVVKNKLYIFHMVLQEASSTKPNRAVANRVRLWSVWFVVSASLFKAPVFCVALTFNPPRCAGSLRFHFHLTVRLLSKHCNMPYACVCMCASSFVIYIFLHLFFWAFHVSSFRRPPSTIPLSLMCRSYTLTVYVFSQMLILVSTQEISDFSLLNVLCYVCL